MVARSLTHSVAALLLTSAALVLTSGLETYAQQAPAPAGEAPQATFRSAVEVVTVSASVRTGGGKVVRDLARADFEVLDSGTLGISTGPVYDPDGMRVGTYNSIWRREADGTWRVIFDNGCPPCDCGAAAAPKAP